jgi:hypothetical protein
MSRQRSRTFLVGLLLALACLALTGSGGASLAPEAEYDLSWWTVDGGGGTLTGEGTYTLSGTAGQPDAAVWFNGTYVLGGGFWGGTLGRYAIYLPLVLR